MRSARLWNMVGFQTKLKHGEQVRIFRTIPGLENAEFARLGGIHRNSFIRSPELLDRELRLKAMPHIRFAGQITGCEGYVESAAIGLLAARFAAAEAQGRTLPAAARNRAWRAARPHHRRRRCRNLPADEHQFRPDAAARGPEAKKADRKRLYTDRARRWRLPKLAEASAGVARRGARHPSIADAQSPRLPLTVRAALACGPVARATIRRGRACRRLSDLLLSASALARTCRSSCTAHSSKLSLPSG